MMKRGVIVGLIVVAILAVGGAAFWGGMKVGQNQVLKNPTAFFRTVRGQGGFAPGEGGTGRQFQGGATVAGGNVTGTVESIDGTTIKVTTQNATVVVQTTDTTLIQKTATVKVSDLQVGEEVVVSGTQNSDGSYTARSIRSGMTAPVGGPAPSGTPATN